MNTLWNTSLRSQTLLTDVFSPMSLIIPAKSHPEVVVQAVAARDRSKAEAFAKSHDIPEIKDSYQGQLSFTINCINPSAEEKKRLLTIQTLIASSSPCLTVFTTNGLFAQFVPANTFCSRNPRHQTQPKPTFSLTCPNSLSLTPRSS